MRHVDPKDKPSIHGDEVLKLALDAIDSFCKSSAKAGRPLSFRFHDQQQVRIPVATKHTGEVVQRAVWQVGFKLGESPADRMISVWVTSDGMVSELSLDEWHGKNCRNK